jgi:hypothetical protein
MKKESKIFEIWKSSLPVGSHGSSDKSEWGWYTPGAQMPIVIRSLYSRSSFPGRSYSPHLPGSCKRYDWLFSGCSEISWCIWSFSCLWNSSILDTSQLVHICNIRKLNSIIQLFNIRISNIRLFDYWIFEGVGEGEGVPLSVGEGCE